MSNYFWLSFCDDTRPKGFQFLGVSIVEGGNIAEAVANAWAMGCNPGGQVAGAGPVDTDLLPADKANNIIKNSNRLMNLEELEREGFA